MCVHLHSYCSGVDICTYQRAQDTVRRSMNGKKEANRVESREAAGNGTDAVEEDERGSGRGTRAGDLK